MQQHESATAGAYPGQMLNPTTAGACGPGGSPSWTHIGGAALAGVDSAGAQAAGASLRPWAQLLQHGLLQDTRAAVHGG